MANVVGIPVPTNLYQIAPPDPLLVPQVGISTGLNPVVSSDTLIPQKISSGAGVGGGVVGLGVGLGLIVGDTVVGGAVTGVPN